MNTKTTEDTINVHASRSGICGRWVNINGHELSLKPECNQIVARIGDFRVCLTLADTETEYGLEIHVEDRKGK